jgi:hypothetical protein
VNREIQNVRVGEYQGWKRRDESEEHDQAKVRARAWGEIGFATGIPGSLAAGQGRAGGYII